MQRAREGAIRLEFGDASHFVHGCDFLGGIYSKVRRFVKTFSGRSRYNVLGALDFVTKAVTTVTNDAYITATTVCELLRKLAAEYPGEEIYLVLDNARYQKCKLVFAEAERLGIVLVYIPPYSPQLNLIERLWKFVKTRLRSRYYNDFDAFKERIDSIITSTATENRELMETLIGEEVQLFDNLVPVTEHTYAPAPDSLSA